MAAESPTPVVPVGEALVVVGLCFGWFIASSVSVVVAGFPASASNAFNDANMLQLIGVEFAFGAAALLFLRQRGYALPALLPAPNWRGCLSGAVLCAVAMLAWGLVAQLFSNGDIEAQPIWQMSDQPRPSLGAVVALSMFNGLYEETILSGYLMRGLAGLGASTAVGVSLLVRVLYHLYQGPIGAVSVLVFGLVLSLFYWRTRTLWPVVFAHTLADVVALM